MPVLWRVLPGLTPYSRMVVAMHAVVQGIVDGSKREQVWLLESPAGYSAGIKSVDSDLTGAGRVPVEHTEGPVRGGGYTYHGPGVLGVTVMLDLRARQIESMTFTALMQRWLLAALVALGVPARARVDDPGGAWLVGADGQPRRLAAAGLRVQRGVTSYGFAVYVRPDLDNFAGIVPCGQRGTVATSLLEQGVDVTMERMEQALQTAFVPVFGSLSTVPLVLP